ncbi:MAG TPA: MFS transporter [Candidatus Nanopelagicaceae bacterium]|nr:MFS transporter [Candidatus Nanopelagicaceae bacterium]
MVKERAGFDLFGHSLFVRLLALRWTSQGMDGLYQSALASFVLFSPERQASASAAAGAFALMLLPYSLIGPFIGTVLDRFPRRQIVLVANSVRALDLLLVASLLVKGETGAVFVGSVLAAFGINRLILSGLSAGLPRLVEHQVLVGANALAVTGGTVATVIGGGLGYFLRKGLEGAIAPDHADGALVLVASLGYLVAALLALRLTRLSLGPLPEETNVAKDRRIFVDGLIDVGSGIRYLRNRVDASLAMIAVSIQRGGLTALTVAALLMERNSFHNPNSPDQGLAGLATVISAAGVGVVLGAAITPFFVQRIGRHRWLRLNLALGSVPALLIAWSNPVSLPLLALGASMCGQAVKVTCDSLVQHHVEDAFRGRVFAIYDMAVNICIVLGASLAALIISPDGRGTPVPLAVAVTYLLYTALLTGRRFKPDLPTSSSTL